MCYKGHRKLKERSSDKGENLYDQGQKNHAERTSRDSSLLHRTRKILWLNNKPTMYHISGYISWVRQYEEKEIQGVTDRRGKAKPGNGITEEDHFRLENKILQAKTKEQEMEIALL